MAVSSKTKKKYNSYLSSAYSPSDAVVSAAAAAGDFRDMQGVFNDSYANSLRTLYNSIKNSPDFNYNAQNDLAYRHFAQEYNALSQLMGAGNAALANSLSGGFGSTYAADAANIGSQRIAQNAKSFIPEFEKLAFDSHIANSDYLRAVYQSALNLRDNELKAYSDSAKNYLAQFDAARRYYSDERDFDYKKYSDNRDFTAENYKTEQENSNADKKLQLKSYGVYEKLAQKKCDEFYEKQDNKGMRAYLNSLVKEGKITSYMADNLYQKNKYTAPKTRSSSGSSRGYSSRRSSSKSRNKSGDDKYSARDHFIPKKSALMYINMHNRAEDYSTALRLIDELIKSGEIDKDERLLYVYYYRDKLK